MPSVVVTALVAVATVAVLVVALVVLRRSRRALSDAERRELAASTESAALRERLDELERRLAAARRAPQEYLITHLGQDDPDPVERRPAQVTLTRPAFADAVLRETVVHAASFVHGLRRALRPETRNRIRFEMRREVKRSRKARKQEVRLAVREYRARQRAAVSEPPHGTEPAA